jgi:hypothetical protein
MRKQLLIAMIATLPIAVPTAQGQSQVVPPQTCGPELVTNGSFEDGNFAPDPARKFMTLPSNSQALTGWNIFSTGNPPNQLAWLDHNNTFGLTSPFSDRFIDLTGITDGATVTVSQQILNPARGNYVLQFAVGWDRARNPPGIVKAEWALDQAGNFHQVPTNGASPNGWEVFRKIVSLSGDKLTLEFRMTTKQTQKDKLGQIVPLQFVGLDNVSLKMLLSPACFGKKLPPIIK